MSEQTVLDLAPRTVPAVPICRSAEDPSRPCRYASVCHESRQRNQHHYAVRGLQCWAFVGYREREARHLPVLPKGAA